MSDVAILGASGFVGAELLRLCALHPMLRPARLFGDSQSGQKLADVLPHLALAYPDLRVEKFDAAALDGVGLVFAALRRGPRTSWRRAACRTRLSPDGVRAPDQVRGVLAKLANLSELRRWALWAP